MFNTKQERLLFKPIAPLLERLYPCFVSRDISKLPDCTLLNKQFNQLNANNKTLFFVEQTDEMDFAELGYEQRIYQHGQIATRNNNWHDFFNALVWLGFPQTKAALNAIHHQEISIQKNTTRSRRRDLLTLFDECGVVVMADEPVLNLIRGHQWHTLFVGKKQLWLDGSITIITFGHAMFEKYLDPYIGMTAKALLLDTKKENLDNWLSEQLNENKLLKTKTELSPLPVLGIPGWHSLQDDAFYANQNYFR